MVDEALETGRAEAARQVAEAAENTARERQAVGVTEAETRTARGEPGQATEAANAARERVEALEAELVERDRRLAHADTAATEAATPHTDALATGEAAHDAELDRVRAEAAAHDGELGGLRAQYEAAQEVGNAWREKLDRDERRSPAFTTYSTPAKAHAVNRNPAAAATAAPTLHRRTADRRRNPSR